MARRVGNDRPKLSTGGDRKSSKTKVSRKDRREREQITRPKKLAGKIENTGLGREKGSKKITATAKGKRGTPDTLKKPKTRGKSCFVQVQKAEQPKKGRCGVEIQKACTVGTQAGQEYRQHAEWDRNEKIKPRKSQTKKKGESGWFRGEVPTNREGDFGSWKCGM